MPKSQNKKDNLIDRIIKLHLYLLILFIPLIFCIHTQTIFTLPKLLAMRFFSISVVFFILFKYFKSEKIVFKKPKGLWVLAIWAFSLILSTIFSSNHFTSIFGQYGRFQGFLTLFNFLLIPIFITQFFQKRDFGKIINFSIFTATLVALYSLLQYFNFFDLIHFNGLWSDSPQNRVFGTIGHANHLGAYLSAHLLLLIYYKNPQILKDKKYLKIISLLLLIVLFFTVIILTASRGAVVALVISTIFLLILKFLKYRNNLKPKTYKILTIGFAILILTGLITYIYKDNLQKLSIISRTNQTIEVIQKGHIPDRLSFLESAWKMFVDYPLLGTGLSTFRDAYSQYRQANFYIDGPGNAMYITTPESAHNLYVDILATQGLFGFIAYLILITFTLDFFIRKYHHSNLEDAKYYLALIGAFSAFLFQTLFNFTDLANAFLFYLIIGFAFSEASEDSGNFEIKIPSFLVYISTFISLLILLFSFKYLVLSPAQADYYLKKANVEALQGQTDLADYYYQKTIEAFHFEYSIYQNYADFLVQTAGQIQIDDLGNKSDIDIASSQKVKYLEKSVENYLKAIELNNHYPSTDHNLALTYLELAKVTKEEEYKNLSKQFYLSAVNKSPNNPRYLYEYARKLHSDWGDIENSIKLLKKGIEIAPSYQEPQDYLNFLYQNHPIYQNPLM